MPFRMRDLRRALLLPTQLPAPTAATALARLALLPLVVVAALAPLGPDALRPSPVDAAESTTIGHSVRGRPIEVGCVGPARSEADATALLVGGIHTGNESITSTLAMELAGEVWGGRLEVPAGVRLCILPVLNPDGLSGGYHTNANEVDLNRNWPAADWQTDAYHPETGPVSGGPQPLSEPETRALFDYLTAQRPSVVLVLHCCGSLVEANSQPLAEDLAHHYVDAAGYDYLPKWNFYEITGEFIGGMERMRIPAFDIEMTAPGDTDLERHTAALEATLAELSRQTRLAEVDTAPTRPTSFERPPVEVARLYRVREGDTMWSIARRFGVTIHGLISINYITDLRQFVPGRVMAIPAPPDVAR